MPNGGNISWTRPSDISANGCASAAANPASRWSASSATDCDDVAVARAALDQGINVSPLSIQYRHGKAQRGLVMGFAAVDANATEKAMIRLRAVLQTHGAG